MIKVYSGNNCVYCEKVKKYLTDNNVDFSVVLVGVDISVDDFIDKFGVMTVPVIDTGDDVIVGYKEDKLKQLLSR